MSHVSHTDVQPMMRLSARGHYVRFPSALYSLSSLFKTCARGFKEREVWTFPPYMKYQLVSHSVLNIILLRIFPPHHGDSGKTGALQNRPMPLPCNSAIWQRFFRETVCCQIMYKQLSELWVVNECKTFRQTLQILKRGRFSFLRKS